MRAVLLLSLAVLTLPRVAVAVAPEVRAEPARVVLGRDVGVRLEVRVPAGAGPVRAAASSGSFAQPVVESGPVRVFQWTPPEVRYPLAAILVFWEEGRSGTPEVAVVRVPLLGRTTLPITTDPGAEVVIEIAEAQFGPVKADRRGKAKVPVEVPPGVKDARVLATRGALKTDRRVPLEVPPHKPLVAVFPQEPLPRSGGWLVVAGEGSVEASALQLTVEGARVAPEPGAPGRYRVSPLQDAESVSVEVKRRDAADSARAQASVIPGEPVEVPAPTVAQAAPVRRGLAVHLLAGGFFAGGANRGPSAALGVSYALPVWNGRLAAELEVGLRRAALEARIEGYGTLHSRVLAGPVLASARMAVLERSAFTLYGRTGLGVMPFQHVVSSDFQPGFDESRLGLMAFLSAQGAYRFGRVSGLVELRAEYGPAHTSRLDAQLGGVGATLGVRYEP
ncbi:hypothetical protein [Hyalangium rubrum]|uniref:Uncharacterized protein n=1 Tax=Hyalangium rubrum TaxID=3103134 RepID=A0ABU5HIA2_9BACT|nr:hypothetical protein [Hyalangium sp. s54d21]MDY7232882.1 hypothetical protein [Hyalangium sp. s54d21]